MTTNQSPQHLVLFAADYPDQLKKELIQVVDDLDYKILPADVGAFKSGERYCELYPEQAYRFNENKADVAGAHVHIVMSMADDPNAFFVDAINTISTVKEQNPATIHLVMPFAPYARQDRDFDNRIVSKMAYTLPKHLKFAGADFMTTFDVHSLAAEQAYVTAFGAENVQFLSMVDELYKAVKTFVPAGEIIKGGAPDGADKPDDVAQRKAKIFMGLFQDRLSSDPTENMFFIGKKREGIDTTRVVSYKGNVEDAYAVEIDDMVDRGDTLVKGAATLKVNKAKKVGGVVTHGIFSGDSMRNLTCDAINGSPNDIDFLVTSDSIVSVHEKRSHLSPMRQDRVKIVSTAPVIKRALAHTFG